MQCIPVLTTIFQSTLPRGERLFCLSSLHTHRIFQSTLPRGERRKAGRTPMEPEAFQSTLPRGERPPAASRPSGAPGYFNPRSHEGSDNRRRRDHAKSKISIHAPTRGATAFRATTSSSSTYFNPRSHEGSDSGQARRRSRGL